MDFGPTQDPPSGFIGVEQQLIATNPAKYSNLIALNSLTLLRLERRSWKLSKDQAFSKCLALTLARTWFKTSSKTLLDRQVPAFW